MNDLHEWFQKNDLCPENILYLYRSDGTPSIVAISALQ